MKYAITAMKKQDMPNGERVILGRTFTQHYLWTKNDSYFLFFDSLNSAKEFWDKFRRYFPDEMMNEVEKDSIAVGNICFLPYLYLESTKNDKDQHTNA